MIVNSRELAIQLDGAWLHRVPVYIEGNPGVGKSNNVEQARARRQALVGQPVGMLDLRLSQRDATDFIGIPDTSGEFTTWKMPDFWPTSGCGVIFLDEINQGSQLVQAASYQLVLDRRLGKYIVPPGWVIWAAGNKQTDRAIVNKMGSALRSRFIQYELSVDHGAWEEWALRAGVHMDVIAYLRWQPAHLHDFDPMRDDKVFACPRTWEMVSKVMQALGTSLPAISGCVGDAKAASFVGFVRIKDDLPVLKKVIASPKTADVPDDKPNVCFAISTALAKMATAANLDAILTYMMRFKRKDFAALAVKLIVRDHPELQKTAAFIDWAAANSERIV